jgi:hypothetical protein
LELWFILLLRPEHTADSGLGYVCHWTNGVPCHSNYSNAPTAHEQIKCNLREGGPGTPYHGRGQRNVIEVCQSVHVNKYETCIIIKK